MDDIPVGSKDGRKIYDNTATVVCCLVRPVGQNKILVIQRKNEPGAGKLALPGGYQMYGESWKLAGQREVFEETGCIVKVTGEPKFLGTDTYNNNVVVAEAQYRGYSARARALALETEVKQIFWLSLSQLNHREWAFSHHFKATKRFLLEKELERI